MSSVNYLTPVIPHYPQPNLYIDLQYQMRGLSLQSKSAAFGHPKITDDGNISLMVNDNAKVDINANHSIRIILGECTIAINNDATSLGIIHPFGRILQEGPDVHITSGIRMSRMSNRGVTFASRKRTLIYLVDSSGCKTTTERFKMLNHDIVTDVFNQEILTVEHSRQKILTDLMRCNHQVYNRRESHSEESWQIAGVRILQRNRNHLHVTKSYEHISINANPNEKQIKVTTPYMKVEITGDSYKFCFQVIKLGHHNQQKVIITKQKFRVKHGNQKAGFDTHERLILS